MIKVDSLNKYFYKGKSREIHVINDVSIELPDKGLVCFLGPSGCGKTTLLNVLGGLDKASGSIYYDNVDYNKLGVNKFDKFRSKNIGYIFQNYNLLLDQTIYDNLKIALELIDVTDPNEIDKRIEYTLKAVGMYKYRKKYAYALSGGQQQRVSIARALIKKATIIIADEPTGNLDTHNTIEVMNILKKISKSALVLLVTHDEKIANFYSDVIFYLKDGEIQRTKENDGNSVLNTNQSNVFYLQDMNKKEVKQNDLDINIYSDEEVNNFKLDCFIRGNTIYIKANKNLKIIDNNEFIIIDDHYKEISHSEVLENDFDTSWYVDKKAKSGFLKNIFNSLKMSFIRLKNVKKRIKLLYFVLMIIGFISSIAVASVVNATMVDVSSTSYSKNLYCFYDSEYNARLDDIAKKAYLNGAIKNLVIPSYNRIGYQKQVVFNQSLYYDDTVSLVYYDKTFCDIELGNEVKNDDEILISSSVADKIIKKSDNKISIDSLIGEKVTLSYKDSEEYKIVGITKNDNAFCYISKNAYAKNIFIDNYYGGVDSSLVVDLRYPELEVDSNQNKLYTVVQGRDVDLDTVVKEVLINDLYAAGVEMGVDTINISGTNYLIVGSYSYPYETSNMYIVNTKSTNELESFAYFENNNLYSVVEGREVMSDDEVIVSVYSNYNIGDIIDGMKVVGKFVGGSMVKYMLLTTFNSALLQLGNYEYLFTIKDVDKINSLNLDKNVVLLTNYEKAIEQAKVVNEEVIIMFEILFVVVALISIIFIYFVMRSKMINDIYPIGVYRCLGGSKLKVSAKFLIDAIVITTFTVVIGYLIGLIGYNILANFFNSFIGFNVLKNNNLYQILGLICIYIVMIFFGMLPIVMLLRKTPAEICSKYDI